MRQLLLLIAISLFLNNGKVQGVREIAIPGLPDIAIATMNQLGPVIYFNPALCQAVGPLATSFFMAHKYGHHNLGHIINGMINSVNPMRNFG